MYLDKRGDVRLPNFQTVDFRVDKPFTLFSRVKVSASMDVFNLLNGNTTLSMRGGPEREQREHHQLAARAARHPVRRARDVLRLRLEAEGLRPEA